MKYLVIITILIFAGCTWFDTPHRGDNTMSGTFIYYDFDPSVFNDPNGVNYLFKSGTKSFIGSIPLKSLISSFYDHQNSIPYQGNFDAVITFDKYGRVDQFQLKRIGDSKIDLSIKAKDHN